jgi:hypothetical protein
MGGDGQQLPSRACQRGLVVAIFMDPCVLKFEMAKGRNKSQGRIAPLTAPLLLTPAYGLWWNSTSSEVIEAVPETFYCTVNTPD